MAAPLRLAGSGIPPADESEGEESEGSGEEVYTSEDDVQELSPPKREMVRTFVHEASRGREQPVCKTTARLWLNQGAERPWHLESALADFRARQLEPFVPLDDDDDDDDDGPPLRALSKRLAEREEYELELRLQHRHGGGPAPVVTMRADETLYALADRINTAVLSRVRGQDWGVDAHLWSFSAQWLARPLRADPIMENFVTADGTRMPRAKARAASVDIPDQLSGPYPECGEGSRFPAQTEEGGTTLYELALTQGAALTFEYDMGTTDAVKVLVKSVRALQPPHAKPRSRRYSL